MSSLLELCLRTSDKCQTRSKTMSEKKDVNSCSHCKSLCDPSHLFLDADGKDNLASCGKKECIKKVLEQSTEWMLERKCPCGKPTDPRYTVEIGAGKIDRLYSAKCSKECYEQSMILAMGDKGKIKCMSCSKKFTFTSRHACERCKTSWYCSKKCLEKSVKSDHIEACSFAQLSRDSIRKAFIDAIEREKKQ